jgi:hypothetical protein
MPRTWVFSLPIVFSDARGARVPGGHICRTLAVAGYIFCRESARSSAGRKGDTMKTIRMRTQWYPTSTSMRGVTWKTLPLNCLRGSLRLFLADGSSIRRPGMS